MYYLPCLTFTIRTSRFYLRLSSEHVYRSCTLMYAHVRLLYVINVFHFLWFGKMKIAAFFREKTTASCCLRCWGLGIKAMRYSCCSWTLDRLPRSPASPTQRPAQLPNASTAGSGQRISPARTTDIKQPTSGSTRFFQLGILSISLLEFRVGI